MARYLVYNFSGELDDISHLFPNDRLARIAAIIRRQGHAVTLIDRANPHDLSSYGSAELENLGALSFYEANDRYQEKVAAEADQLLKGNYDSIFLNLWHGTGFKFTMDLAFRLKKTRPSLRLYGVGQKVDWFKGHILTLASNGLDGLITGLGYNAVDALVRGVALEDCPNTLYLRDGRPHENPCHVIDVDDYPAACYENDIYQQIDQKLPLFTLSLSNQACPNQCVFCIRPENYGRINVRRKTESVLAEMQNAFHRFGIRHFRFEDSTPPAGALTDISRAILQSELSGRIRFSAFSRVDTNHLEDFPALYQAGCTALFFGGESLDDNNLQHLRKGTTYSLIRETLQRAHDAGIHTVSNFIIPIPGETAESLETTYARLVECRDILDSFLALPAGVYPPTEWGEHPERYGILLDDDYWEKLVTYPIRYLFPLQLWPQLPYRYSMMGKPAHEVDPTDIFTVHEQFARRVRETIGLFPVPDYVFLLNDLLPAPAAEATRMLVSLMIARDYDGIAALFRKDTSAS